MKYWITKQLELGLVLNGTDVSIEKKTLQDSSPLYLFVLRYLTKFSVCAQKS